MTQVFEDPIRIRFAHCDPAGIVYHPHFFTMFNGVLEDFFREVICHPFINLIHEGYGFPVVGIRSDFIYPVKAGDEAIARLWIEKMGHASVHFAMTLSVGDTVCVKLLETSVFVKKGEQMTPIGIPEWFASKALPYVAGDDITPLVLRA